MLPMLPTQPLAVFVLANAIPSGRVVTFPLPDAGVPGADAGVSGADAGLGDAGLGAASVGPPPEPLSLRVGCGCSADGVTGALGGMAGSLVLRRRRRARV